MMTNEREAIRLTYQGIRSRRPSYPAGKALAEARERVTNGGRRYYGKLGTAGLGAPMDDGGQWAERPSALGLRFVGFADEIGSRYDRRPVDHRGWFIDLHESEVARPCVYLLPSRDGRTRYVPAYREGSEISGTWRDMSGEESAVVYLRDVELGDAGGADGTSLEQAAIDAARYADSRAERHAESCKEFAEAWQAGQAYDSAMDEARSARAAFLELRKAMKADSRAPAAIICTALSDKLGQLVETWRECKAKAAELASEWQAPASSAASSAWQRRKAELAATFRESAGISGESCNA